MKRKKDEHWRYIWDNGLGLRFLNCWWLVVYCAHSILNCEVTSRIHDMGFLWHFCSSYLQAWAWNELQLCSTWSHSWFMSPSMLS
jgi:hypothetical protein